MNTKTSLNRRQLVKLGAGAAAGLIIARTSVAEEVALSESDPTAVALGYAEDASAVDTAKWSKKAGPGGDQQFCNNCSLYRPIDDAWGGCSIFPGKKVKGAGWCNAWVGG
jgi:hypothetical protein